MITTLRTGRTSVARKLTTTISAVAIALAGMTAAAVPARANNDDIAKFLFGATTLFIIGSAIANGNRGHAQPQPQRPVVVHPPRPPHGHGHGYGQNRPPVLPAACAISISGAGHSYYGERCLRDNGVRVALPARCERTMRTNRGNRTVYEGQCLVNAGFQVEQRGHGRNDRTVRR